LILNLLHTGCPIYYTTYLHKRQHTDRHTFKSRSNI